MSILRYTTNQSWVDTVISDFEIFLPDHAAAEKKAAGMAMSMISHYPDRNELVATMLEICVEETAHFREVVKLMLARNIVLTPDTKDLYVNSLRKQMRQGTDVYLLDRLLIGGIIEARGCERFGLIADALEPGDLKDFYVAITASEARHEEEFIDLAKLYFPNTVVEERIDALLDIEADICSKLPLRPALH
jgi:tRNA-(ms[2]io[6]A)-hydroxylase